MKRKPKIRNRAMTIDRERVRVLIDQHRPVLNALAHYDGCTTCQEGNTETCSVLQSILHPQESSDE